jgi:hypothetical protein
VGRCFQREFESRHRSDRDSVHEARRQRRRIGLTSDCEFVWPRERHAAIPCGQPVDVARVSKLEPGRTTGDEWKFSGRAQIGASDIRGNTNERNLNWDAEGVARQGKNRYTLGGRGTYGSDSGEETDNNTIIYAQYDRFVSKKWYSYGNLNLQNTSSTTSGFAPSAAPVSATSGSTRNAPSSRWKPVPPMCTPNITGRRPNNSWPLVW